MTSFTRTALTGLALLLMPTTAQAATTIVSFDRSPAAGAAGDPRNTVVLRDLGAWAHITAIAYALSVEATDPSNLSGQQAWFGTSDDVWAKFTPDRTTDTPGTAQVDGVTDLVAEDRDFFLNEDGLLRIELLDTVNTETAPHGFWSGRFTITAEGGSTDAAVPEPATWAMMIAGFGAVGATLRRRRTAASAAARVSCCDTLKNGRSLTA